MSDDAYNEVLKDLEKLKLRGIHKGLGSMEAALRLIKNPHLCFPSIHIAGTNGKGSTSAMTAEILKRSGFRTGLTISPHLEDIRERIQLNGEWISKENFISIHQKLKPAIGHLELTYFEWTILMAFVAFAEANVDIAVVETGMGGRWDATNVLLPLTAAITTVGLDHQEFLGHRTEDILGEKLQIFKPGSTAWTGVTDPKLVSLIRNYCREKNIKINFLDDAFKSNADGTFSIFQYRLECALKGEHQKRNAALAIALCNSLNERGYLIRKGAVEGAMANVVWPGRLETVTQKPLVLLDGAHNADGIEALRVFLSTQDKKFHLVFGALKDRPFLSLLKPLLPYAVDTYGAVFDGGDRSITEGELQKILQEVEGAKVLVVNEENWKKFMEKVRPDESVLVTGSLYLVSQIRSFIKGKS